MSPNITLLFYLLLEHGSLHDGNALLFRPLCADGRLQPPLISELRALRPDVDNSRTGPLADEPLITAAKPSRIELATPYSGIFTLRVPWSHFPETSLDAASCFG